MSAKILILILILLILLSWNCNKESFSVKSHFIVNGAAPGTADTSTYKLTNNIVKKGNSYKSSDFQSNGFLNMYTQFGSHYFPKNLYPSDNQIPVLILESYRSCPTLYNLYRNLIRYDSQGKNQTETVEGARIRSLIQSTFFNINQPAPMDYQILEMYALDKNNVSQEQPRLNLSLDKKDINNSKIVSLINDPIIQAKFAPNFEITNNSDNYLKTKDMYFTLHKQFKITFTLKKKGWTGNTIPLKNPPTSIDANIFRFSKLIDSNTCDGCQNIVLYYTEKLLKFRFDIKNDTGGSKSIGIFFKDFTIDLKSEYKIEILKKQDGNFELKINENTITNFITPTADQNEYDKIRVFFSDNIIKKYGTSTATKFTVHWSISDFTYEKIEPINNNQYLVSKINNPVIQAKFAPNFEITNNYSDDDLKTKGMYFTLHKEFKITFTLKKKGWTGNTIPLKNPPTSIDANIFRFSKLIDSNTCDGCQNIVLYYTEKLLKFRFDIKNDTGGSKSIGIFFKDFTIDLKSEYKIEILKKQDGNFELKINENTITNFITPTVNQNEYDKIRVFFSDNIIKDYGTSTSDGTNTATKFTDHWTLSDFTYNNLTEPKITYKSPNYNYNEKNSTFGIKEDYTLPDIMRFMDFGFTTLCWGALHINLLKPLDNHYYGFPCQNEKCNTSSTANYYFYLLPVRIRQMCFEEGKKYTRAKCNHCASNIIVYFDILPSKFKNLNVLNNTDTTALHNLI